MRIALTEAAARSLNSPPSRSGGAWKERLYSFNGNDGSLPDANLVILGGKVYGTTVYGGGNPNGGTDNGPVFEIGR
jgi:hypothetical protein